MPHELAGSPQVRVPLARILTEWAPGSHVQPWTWDDEERELLAFRCLCATVDPLVEFIECPTPGHYQLMLEAHAAEHGISQPVCLGPDGRVWDGHHRIVAARRLGLDSLPVEVFTDDPSDPENGTLVPDSSDGAL